MKEMDMARPKARRTKTAFVQVRVESHDKATLQQWVDSLGITMSTLMRLVVKNLVVIANSK